MNQKDAKLDCSTDPSSCTQTVAISLEQIKMWQGCNENWEVKKYIQNTWNNFNGTKYDMLLMAKTQLYNFLVKPH